jgi:hypothetical protein
MNRTIAYEEMNDPIIFRGFLEAYNERMIDAGYLSRNKDVKTNCVTLRPRRGAYREFKDIYLTMSIQCPYIKEDSIRCRINRIAAFLFLGDLLPGLFSLHKCDVKMCCNPDHLYIGTRINNRTDRNNRRGDKSLNGEPTRYEWESINYWKNRGEHTACELAKHFNIHSSSIRDGGDSFTTDGSEIIGPVFIPKIIPEAIKVTIVKQAIHQGNEFIKTIKTCKRLGWLSADEIRDEAHDLGICFSEAGRQMRLAKANPHPENYKYGKTILIRMIIQGIDISVPV